MKKTVQVTMVGNFGLGETGKSSMTMLRPSPDVCQECAVKHPPNEPHNRDSLFYQMKFRGDHGRWPTWADAIAHCSEAVRKDLREYLETKGLWSEPVEGMSAEEKVARAVGSLPTHSLKPDGRDMLSKVITVDMGKEKGGVKKRPNHGPRPKDGRGKPRKARGRGRHSP